MSCIINQNIQNCNYILDGINKLYISSVKNVEYSFEDNEFIDIFTEMNWFEIEFNAIEFNTEYQNKIYSTTITVQINNINNEINFFENNKYNILLVDSNKQNYVDGILNGDNQYTITNITTVLDDNNTNSISFDLVKSSIFDIKKINENYYTFNL
jgi:hypothetical protein